MNKTEADILALYLTEAGAKGVSVEYALEPLGKWFVELPLPSGHLLVIFDALVVNKE